MTTIIATRKKILSDGKSTVGDRIDDYNLKKVRKINGYLVGGAGRLSSVFNFFDWFESKTEADAVQDNFPNIFIDSTPSTTDDEFLALVVTPKGEIYLHEGNHPSRAYKLITDYYAIGSGADFALAALDGGATPEVAMEVAKKRDAFSGGETFVEERDEQVELTADSLMNASREDLLQMLAETLGVELPEEEPKCVVEPVGPPVAPGGATFVTGPCTVPKDKREEMKELIEKSFPIAKEDKHASEVQS